MHPDSHEEEALGKVYDAQLIRRLWPYLSPHRLLIALSVLLIPVRSLFEIIPAPLIGIGLNHLTGVESSSESLERLAFLADKLIAGEPVSDGDRQYYRDCATRDTLFPELELEWFARVEFPA